MNNVNIIGRLTRDPELRFTQSGTGVCNMTIAVDGYQDETYFFNIVQWGNGASNTAEYCRKGRQIGVSGELRSRSYETNDGQKRYVTEIHCNTVDWLREPNATNEDNNGQNNKTQNNNNRANNQNNKGRNSANNRR